MTHRLRIAVDHDRCVGNAMCVATAPGVFEHDEKRQSVPIDPEAGPRESILEAAANCPVSAITVRDGSTGQRLFPPEDSP